MNKNNTQNNINFAALWPIEEHYFNKHNIIFLLSRIFKTSFKVLMPPDLDIGVKLPNGSWSGMLGMINKYEADLAIGGVALTEERFHHFTFSYPYKFSELTFMADKPMPKYTSMHIFSPFSLSIWALLIFFIILVSLIMFMVANRKESYNTILFELFSSLLGESLSIKKIKRAIKILICFWLLFGFIIANSYKVVLLAMQSVPEMSGIRDISDLSKAAQEKSVICHINKGSAFTKIFLESNIESWKSIGQCIKRSMQNENFSTTSRTNVYIGFRDYFTKNSRKYISKESFFNSMGAFPVSEKFCCLKKLNTVVHRLFAAGVFQKLWNDEMFLRELKNGEYQTHSSKNPNLGIQDLKGAFYVLILGHTLAFTVFLLEIIGHFFHSRKRRNK